MGPCLYIAALRGGDLVDLLQSSRPYEIAAWLIREAESKPGTILVLEDLHWADEATLDVISVLGRRIEMVPALLVATYRDDELDRAHPLRRLLGELRSGGAIRRLTAQPPAGAAVRARAAPRARAPGPPRGASCSATGAAAAPPAGSPRSRCRSPPSGRSPSRPAST